MATTIDYYAFANNIFSAGLNDAKNYWPMILEGAASLEGKYGIWGPTYTVASILPCLLHHKAHYKPTGHAFKKLEQTIDELLSKLPDLQRAYGHLNQYWKLKANGRSTSIMKDVCEVNGSWISWRLFEDGFHADNKEAVGVTILLGTLLTHTAATSIDTSE